MKKREEEYRMKEEIVKRANRLEIGAKELAKKLSYRRLINILDSFNLIKKVRPKKITKLI